MSDKEYIAEYKDIRIEFTFCGGSNRECTKAIKNSMKREYPDIDFKDLNIKRG